MKRGKRVRRFYVLVALVAMLAMALSMTGCSKGSDSGKEAPAAGGGEQQKVVELTFAHPFPATHTHHVGIIEPFIKELETKSNGRIKITLHPGGSIVTGTSALDDVVSGAVDMVWTIPGYTPGRFPLSGMVEAPSTFKSGVEGTEVLWDMIDTNAEIQKEYSDMKLLAVFVTDIADIYTRNKPIKKPDDLKGVTIRSSSQMLDQTLKAWGASPINMPISDAYDAIDRGVVDGVCVGASGVPAYGFQEIVKYGTEGLGVYVSPQVFLMSKKAWDKLSPEDQQLVESLSGRELSVKASKLYDDENQKGLDTLAAAKADTYKMTDEDVKEFAEKAMSVVDAYIKSVEDKGLNGRAFYDDMIKARDARRK